MRAVLGFITSVGGSATLTAIAISVLFGALFDDLRNTLIAIAVLTGLVILALVVRKLRHANRRIDEIFDDELD